MASLGLLLINSKLWPIQKNTAEVSLNTQVLEALTVQGGFSSTQAQQLPVYFCKGHVELQ